MSYQVLSLKWRPQAFDDVVGQDHLTKTLINAFKKDRVAQAYILTGPRGVGKTTTARIISKALNCPKTKSGVPCNQCNICQEIIDGRNLDVLEIDGASNRGIEEIRNLREQIKYTPMGSNYKVFIIDEVHMLTNQAFNALLRTLEEPPSHGKFILATTDIHKVPSTIISRCQRFDFNRITSEVISKRLSVILKSENIAIDNESLLSISQKADGSMRDALSLLDQVIAYSGESIAIEDVSTVIGLIPNEIYFDFTDAIVEKDYNKMMSVISSIQNAGLSLQDVSQGLIKHCNNLLISSVDKGEELLLDINEEAKNRYISTYKNHNSKDLIRISKVLHDMQYSLKQVSQPMIVFEMTALKLIEMDTALSISELISNLSSSVPKKKIIQKNKTNSSSKEKLTVSNNNESKKISDIPIDSNDKVEKKINYSLNIDVVKEKWDDFVDKVSKQRPSIGAILDNAEPLELNENLLTVNIFDLPKFSIGNLEHNQELINQFAQEHYDMALKIIPKLMESDKAGHKLKDNDPKMNKDDAATSKDAVVSKVLEVFDGEILR
jgi:DNA polymerase-3 subunit gamma/tau|tara:strand:+ start:819 stop:2471 length:1653 start_codon:yes stop_codon:yes gene_type:complete